MSKKKLVSVIVPVYNVEKYLRRCLETVVAQSLQDIEVILVDDGSTDSSGVICDEYKKKYPDMIRVIHKENGGLGPARNSGLEIATGDYIGFVDSDDWITIDMFEKLYNYAESNRYDMVFCDMFYVDAAKSTITKSSLYYKNEPCLVTTEQAFVNGVYCYAWNKLYKAELIKDKRFPNLVFEDIPVITNVIANCSRIGYLPESLYFYERKPGTLSTSYKSAKMLDTIDVEKLALSNASSECREILLFVFAKRFFQNIYSERKVMKADLVEHIQQYADEYKTNSYIKKYKQERIYKFLDCVTIPKNIFYANFGKRDYSEYEEACINSWQNMTRGFNFIELNEDNCDISSAPEKVRQAFVEQNYNMVNDYFKLKNVYDNGGIAIDPCIYFNAPIGELRMEKTFFGFENKNMLLENIFGSVKGTTVIEDILQTYEADSIYSRNDETFKERLTAILINKYGLVNRGWTQTLNDTIKVYKCDVLAYDMHSSNNITKLITEMSYKLLDSDYEIIDSSILQYWSEDRDNFWKQKEEIRKQLSNVGTNMNDKENALLQKKLNEAYAELAQLKNSKSWKITAPLRKLYRYIHKSR